MLDGAHDSCPNCGHRRKPYLMASHPDHQALPPEVVKWGLAVIAVLAIVCTIAVFHIHLPS